MNIFYTLDENFVPQVATNIISICENNKSLDEIIFYLVSPGLSPSTQEKLKNMVSRYHREVKFIKLKDLKSYINVDFDTGAFHPIVLARLLVDQLLPKSIDKVLYMDGDTIVRGSLKPLYENDMDGKIIGMSIEPPAGCEVKKHLGLQNSHYYNAGVVLINLKKWRKEKIGQKLIKYFKDNCKTKQFKYNDQDILNCFFQDEIYTLSPKYNYTNMLDYYSYKSLCWMEKPAHYISKTIYDDAIKNPVIIHYLGLERPWRKYNTHKYRYDYKKYLDLTPWRDTPDEDGFFLSFLCWRIFNLITKPSGKLRFLLGKKLLTPIVLRIDANNQKKSS